MTVEELLEKLESLPPECKDMKVQISVGWECATVDEVTTDRYRVTLTGG